MEHFNTNVAEMMEESIIKYGDYPILTFDNIKNNEKLEDKDNKELSFIEHCKNKLNKKEFMSDPDSATVEVVSSLLMFFDFALIDNDLPYQESLYVFDETRGLYLHTENMMKDLIGLISPGKSRGDFEKIITYLGTVVKLNRGGKELQPYEGSNWLLFKNGALNMATMDFEPLDSQSVRDLNFTIKHRLNIDYNPDIKNVVLKGMGVDGRDWSVDEFLNVYSGDNPEARDYILFCLSLGLTPGHNSGGHVSIEGLSGSGKSTLFEIFKGLYGSKKVIQRTYDDLLKDFALDSITHDTALIWIKECNKGIRPLADNAEKLFNSLADGDTAIARKHTGSILLKNPPQMYIDGTSLIQTDDVNNGASRRTLPIRLPQNMRDKDIQERYFTEFISIKDVLKREDVLQCFVNLMIEANQKFLSPKEMENHEIKLHSKAYLSKFPNILVEWREGFVSDSSPVKRCYVERIRDFLILDTDKALLSDRILYEIYLKWHLDNSDGKGRFLKSFERFKDDLHGLYKDDGYYRVYLHEKRKERKKWIRRSTGPSGPEALGINWEYGECYDKFFIRPEKLLYSSSWPELFERNLNEGYILVSKEPTPELFEKSDDGGYDRKWLAGDEDASSWNSELISKI